MRKPASFYFFKRKPIVLKDRYECWRGVADLLGFTTQERLRVEWMVFYYTAGKENAALTAQHFGISRKTFHKWSKRFRDSKYDVHSLADRSRAPHRKRHWEVTLIQEERIRCLRKRYPYYGKKKLKVLYEKEYSEGISTWKIERVVRRYKLYPDQNKAEKTARKRARARQKPKKRITQLAKEGRPCFLFQLDTIVIYWNSLKRYILTAVDHATKLGYARMYKNKSSKSATDFLYRLRYLVDQPIENLQTDNGSEFAWEFERASAGLGIQRYFSRVKTPKDNPEIERFNQTLEYEWLYNFNLSLDPEELNPRLTEWLIEYNFNRPHQSLAYLAPVEYIEKELAKIRGPVLPMWSASWFFSTVVDTPSKPVYNSAYMGYRKPKDNSDMPKVLGLTPIRWLLLLISFIISLVIGQVGSDLIAELAQKIRPDDVAFLKFMLVVSFLGSVAILFVILDGLFVKRRRNRG